MVRRRKNVTKKSRLNAKPRTPISAVTFYRGRNASNLKFLVISVTLKNLIFSSFEALGKK